MIKVIYSVCSIFSLKKYNDSHLSARSYEYPMLSTIRGAILSSIIERKGRKVAEELFRKVKNAQIFIQYPETFNIGQQKIKRMSNNGYFAKYSEENKNKWENNFTVGIREVVATDKIVFYIDESIENILEYLVNIDRIGDSESLVILEKIERVTAMENILMEWNESVGYDVKLYEVYDWKTKIKQKSTGRGKNKTFTEIDSGTSFEDRYIYSGTTKDNNIRRICYIKDRVEL